VPFPLYLDEDSVNRALIRALQARGVDVTNAIDSGQAGTDDIEQLRHAAAEGRVLLTYNIKDFSELHKELVAQGESHSGIILAPQQRYSIGEQMRRILRIRNGLSSDEMKGRVEYLSGWG